MEKSKRIILVGAACSGKDYMRKIFENKGFKYAVSYTTRPPRTGEVDGEDYFFLSEADFKRRIAEGFWYEYVDFNGWYYGTSKEQFYNDDIFIMTVSGISEISKEDRENSFIIFIDATEELRRERMTTRDMPGDTVDRRIEADNADLKGFTDYDIKVPGTF